jgi:hypothetical protein
VTIVFAKITMSCALHAASRSAAEELMRRLPKYPSKKQALVVLTEVLETSNASTEG